MSDPGPLIVPMQVDAWVLNPWTITSNALTRSSVRAQMAYGNLAAGGDPSPPPFHADDSNFVREPANHGVYVMWTLPKALRHATQDASGTRTFPLVPNRWLVVRLFQPAAPVPTPTGAAPAVAAWVVASDVLGIPLGAQHLDPRATTAMPTLIGQKVSVSDASPWTEPTTAPPPFLRAVADGNPTFAAYQSFNQNVFSIHDDEVTTLADGVLSYQVVGWYSDPEADVLAGWGPGNADTSFASLMSRLGWLSTDADASTCSSVYQGLAAGVPWTPDGPTTDPVVPPTVTVAAGNTTIDGIVAFAEAAIGTAGSPVSARRARDLLESFQYEMLTELATGSELLIGDRLRQHWFGGRPGGTRWTIVDAETTGGAAPAPSSTEEQAAETAWLAALNTAQAALDSDGRRLLSERRRLMELWWKGGFATYAQKHRGRLPAGITSADEIPTALTAQATVVGGLLDDLATAATQIPTPTPGQTFDEAVLAFAKAKGLPESRILKAVPGRPFALPVDPVVMVAGTRSSMDLDPRPTLACRWPDELVAGLHVAPAGSEPYTTTAAEVAGLVGLADAGLPPIVPALCAELFLLDPANAGPAAAAAGHPLPTDAVPTAAASIAHPVPTSGTVPAVLPPWPWAQPWRPLYLDWEIQWRPIPFADWVFDGQDHTTADGATATTLEVLSGRAILTPQASFQFRSTLERFVHDNPDSPVATDLGDLDTLLAPDWDLLSQALGGLTTQLALWNPITLVDPDDSVPADGRTISELLGDFPESPPASLLERAPAGVTSTFDGLRAGQLTFQALGVVDAFGQYLDILDHQGASSFQLLRAEGVVPAHPVVAQDQTAVVELPPRLLQPARLNLDFVGSGTDGSPILGWLLPNHLDAGIAVYGPDGAAYGELRPGIEPDGEPIVAWAPCAGSPYPALASIVTDHPALGGVLTGLQAAGATGFAAVIHAIDETLWTIDPLGARTDQFLSVMLGRPIAVVAASLSLELQADPYRDPSWPFTFDDTVQPTFPTYDFPVRLGDLGYAQDGLLGYYSTGDWNELHAVHVPTPDPYLCPVAPGAYVPVRFAPRAGPGPAQQLTLLMDPRASVHAASGILPSITAILDPSWVDRGLKALAASFTTGPVLAASDLAPDGTPRLLLPSPAERHGTWSWSDAPLAGAEPISTVLGPVSAAPSFPATPPTLREGSLNLRDAFDDDPPHH